MRQETAALRNFSPAYVRFGSGADITCLPSHVRFTPQSGHRALARLFASRQSRHKCGAALRRPEIACTKSLYFAQKALSLWSFMCKARQSPGVSEPRAFTPEPPGRARQWRYADGVIDQRRHRWIGVREDHTVGGELVNAVVAVDFGGGSGHVLASGHDFYASPRLSPDGRWLAWLAWDHPNMPWNGTRLYLGEVAQNGAISNVEPI